MKSWVGTGEEREGKSVCYAEMIVRVLAECPTYGSIRANFESLLDLVKLRPFMLNLLV